MVIPPAYTDNTYIGDGVYAAFNGYQIWLFTERDGGMTHMIALEPNMLAVLQDYWAALKRKYEDRRP